MQNFSITKIPGVYYTHNRKTCIAVKRTRRGTIYYVTLGGGRGIHVLNDKEDEFFLKYVYDEGYPVDKAARYYIDAYKLFGGAKEALELLQKII